MRWIRDRQGNKVSFTYGAGNRISGITDALNRQITITYSIPGGSYYGEVSHYDAITFSGFGGAERTIKVWHLSLRNLLRTTQPTDSWTTKTYHALFPLNSASQTEHYNRGKVWKIELPDTRYYEFKYNEYGELARVMLPTGGAFEYDWAGGADEVDGVIFRYVTERRVYANGGTTPENKTQYVTSIGGPDYEVEVKVSDAANTLLASSRHYFHGDPSASIREDPARPSAITFSPWREGREYRTETFDVVNGTPVLKQRVEQTWQQPTEGSTWPLIQAETSPDVKPNNPQITQTVTTLVDTNQVTKQTFKYDQYSNRTDVFEYGYGTGTAGVLLRHAHTDYLTTNTVNGIAYDYACHPATTCQDATTPINELIHLRGLPIAMWVNKEEGENNKQSLTTYEYDNYTPDTNNRHAALIARPNISGLCTSLDEDGVCTNIALFPTDHLVRGNPTSTTSQIYLNGSVLGSISSYRQYDVAGNVVKAIDGRGYATTVGFDDNFGAPDAEARLNTAPAGLGWQASYAFPTTATNALGHTAYTQYDYSTGSVVNTEDANATVGSIRYDDVLGRPTQAERAVNIPALRGQTTFNYDDANRIITTTSDLHSFNDNVLKSQTLYDTLGRTIESRQYETGTQYVATRQEYDSLGRVKKTSNPFRPALAENPVWTTTEYDSLGRVFKVTTPDAAKVMTNYLGTVVMVTDQAGKSRRSETDALGRLKKVVEYTRTFTDPTGVEEPNASDYTTTYEYDTLNNLMTVTQGGQTRSFVYDSLSRLKSATNPESGTISYTYDANGNLLTKTDARNTSTTYTYDELSRVKTRVYSDGTPQVSYAYDAGIPNAKGRLVSVASSVSTTNYTGYDALGRVESSAQMTDGQTYTMAYAYDRAGNVVSQTYPSGKVVTTQVDSAGRVAGVKNQATGGYYAGAAASDASNRIRYTAHGAVEAIKLGNGLWEHTIFNARLQPTHIGLGLSSSNSGVLQLDYSYGTTGNNGNVESQTITLPGLTLTQNYAYDALNRLATARETSGATQTWKQRFTSDRFGNRNFHTSETTPNVMGENPAINGANNRISASGYRYDAAGNLECDAHHACSGVTPYYAYDAENRMRTAGGGAHASSSTSATYAYDGDGRRVKKIVGIVTTVYVYNAVGQLLAEYGSQASGSGTSYLTQDTLGSTRVVTDANGGVKSRHDYLPFGEELQAGGGGRTTGQGYSSNDGVRQKFGDGYERDDETGLDYAKARYFSSTQGRFTSVDTFGGFAVGGTGMYAGATGRLLETGTFTPQDGGYSDYTGEICTP